MEGMDKLWLPVGGKLALLDGQVNHVQQAVLQEGAGYLQTIAINPINPVTLLLFILFIIILRVLLSISFKEKGGGG